MKLLPFSLLLSLVFLTTCSTTMFGQGSGGTKVDFVPTRLLNIICISDPNNSKIQGLLNSIPADATYDSIFVVGPQVVVTKLVDSVHKLVSANRKSQIVAYAMNPPATTVHKLFGESIQVTAGILSSTPKQITALGSTINYLPLTFSFSTEKSVPPKVDITIIE